MEDNFAKSQIKRTERNKIIRNIIIIVIISCMYYFNNDSLYNLYIKETQFKFGSQLEQIYNGKNKYVSSKVERLVTSGYVIHTNGEGTDKYFVAYVGDMYVVCRANKKMTKPEYLNYDIKGVVKKPTLREREIIGELQKDLDANQEENNLSKEEIAPYIINLSASQIWNQIFVGIGIIFVFVLIAKIIISIKNILDYTKSKSYRKMEIDDSRDSQWVNEDISEDLLKSENEYIFNNKKIVITKKWIISKEFSKFEVIPISELIWIYKTITQHRVYGAPAGKSYSILLAFKNRKRFTITQKNEKISNETIEKFQNELKHVVYGFSEDLLNVYNVDMNKFIEIQNIIEENEKKK